MHDNSSETTRDRLTDILRDLRLDGLDYGRRHLEGAWAFAFPAKGHAMFHFIAGRPCWLKRPTGEWTQLLSGDAVLITRGDAHALASAPDAISKAATILVAGTCCFKFHRRVKGSHRSHAPRQG